MKKFFFLFVLFLSSCSIFQNYQGTENNDKNSSQPAKNADAAANVSNKPFSPNKKCEDFPAVKVFQVLDEFSLGFACKTFDAKDLFCVGFTVYIPKEKGKIYYDDQIIEPPTGKCFVFNDTYRYETRNGMLKTIPVVSFENKTIRIKK